MKKTHFFICLVISIIVVGILVFAIFNEIRRVERTYQAPDVSQPSELPDTIEIPAELEPQEDEPRTELPAIAINYQDHGGRLELPVNGATGWAASAVPLRGEPRAEAGIIQNLAPGQGFTILEERNAWWHVRLSGGRFGWVEHRGCFINLPDVIPSIVYDITNAYSSIKLSSGFEIPNVTGRALYEAWVFNARLNREEFIVPALYSMSRKLFEAQRAALAGGDTIIIYEAFRPLQTQRRVVSNLVNLIGSNEQVRRGIETPPWGLNWFIATSLSNHQRGAAVDVSLGRVISLDNRNSGDFVYSQITEFEEYAMPTAMHELSSLAAVFRYPVSSTSPDAWRGVPLADAVTEGVTRLQSYFAGAGFTPLASEWWHFNDLESAQIASGIRITGEFFCETVYSAAARIHRPD